LISVLPAPGQGADPDQYATRRNAVMMPVKSLSEEF
jgi:hypothetical protein